MEKGQSIQNRLRKGMSHQQFATSQPTETAVFVNDVIKHVSEEAVINLPPTPIKETEFTKEEEDKVILQYYMKHGPRRDKIATIVSGRSAVQIKNRYNTVIKKNIITGKFDI